MLPLPQDILRHARIKRRRQKEIEKSGARHLGALQVGIRKRQVCQQRLGNLPRRTVQRPRGYHGNIGGQIPVGPVPWYLHGKGRNRLVRELSGGNGLTECAEQHLPYLLMGGFYDLRHDPSHSSPAIGRIAIST